MALAGAKVGQSVEFNAPNGAELSVEIVAIDG